MPATAAAQQLAGTAAHPDPTHYYQTWAGFDFQGLIHGDLFVFGDVQYRGYDNFEPVAVLMRAGLLARLMDNMFLGGGYIWQPAWTLPSAGHVFIDEHRIFQQFAYEWVDSREGGTGIKIHFRTRVEERFRHPTSTVEFGVRVRQRVRLIAPLTTDRALSFIAWDEFFVNLTDSGHSPNGVDMMGMTTYTPFWENSGYDQNRLFVGMGYQFVPGVVRLELGYVNQFVRRPGNAAGDAMNHIALLNVSLGWH